MASPRAFVCLLFLALVAPACAAKWVLHADAALAAADRAGLEASIARAVAAFERAVGPLARPVVVRVGESSLQSGGEFSRNVLQLLFFLHAFRSRESMPAL